ncbi:MAG: hypothetical protein IT317_15430 [Anaerolineales bacterium]|nr:hypothetical protein [Anaerolineales bacterium]
MWHGVSWRGLLRLCVLALLLAGAPVGAPAAAGEPVVSYLPLISRYYPLGDVAVSRVEVIQGITLGDSYTVHVAHRPALLRVFVTVTGPDHLEGVAARLTRYVGGNPQDSLTVGPQTVFAATNEGNLAHTLNFSLPAGWLAPGTSYVLQLDPDNLLPESDEGNNRFPSGSGQQAFNFVNVPTLDVVIVPVQYARPGAPVSLPPTADLSYLTWMPFKVFPVSQINYTVRGSALNFTGDLRTGGGWNALLDAVTTIHAGEDPSQTKLYYGLVDSVAVDGCSGGCIAGIGWIGLKSSAGFAGFVSNRNEASPTFTHEMGHNFGRLHAPCGNPSGPGPYPYPGGAPIGQWGYDPATGLLYAPNVYKDYMSYCGPEWTSDFTYYNIANALVTAQATANGNVTDALVVSGWLASGGAPQVYPAFVERVPSAQIAAQSGPYQLQVLDAQGQVLAAQDFTPVEAAQDVQGGAPNQTADALGFRVALPVLDGAVRLRLVQGGAVLWERAASGPAPTLRPSGTLNAQANGKFDWRLDAGEPGVTYRLSVSGDGGATWTLIAPATNVPKLSLVDGGLPAGPYWLIEVQASDGVRVTRRTYTLDRR